MRKALRSHFLLLFLVVCVGGEALPTTLPPLPRLNLGNTFQTVRAQIDQAFAAAQAHPGDATANGRLGMLLDAYQQYGAAAVCYRRAHLLDSASYRWIYNLGFAEMKLGEYNQAAAAFRTALKLRPGELPPRMYLAESLLAGGAAKESGPIFRAIIAKYPGSAEAWYGLGRVESAEGNTQAAVAAFQKACQLFPEYGASHYALALAYRKLGEAQKAAPHFAAYKKNVTTVPPLVDPERQAVEQLNQGPLARMRRGRELAQSGNLEGAIAEYLAAIKIDPKLVQAHINLIQLYARTGNTAAAEQEYETAVQLDPNHADCYYDYGVLMFELQQDAKAEAAFRRAIEINPYYPEAHNNLGFLLAREGKLSEAMAEFRSAVAERPDYRLARFHIGQILVGEGKYPQAIQEFSKILAPDDASTPAYLYALGATYARAGDMVHAAQWMRKAHEEAAARGQTQLAASIDHDLKSIQQSSNP